MKSVKPDKPRKINDLTRFPAGKRPELRPKPAGRADIDRELAFFRKHRHRMRYHALKQQGIAIGSGLVEAANKTLVTQRTGMRWRIVGGQAVLTFRALIKSGRFESAWTAMIGADDAPANDNISLHHTPAPAA